MMAMWELFRARGAGAVGGETRWEACRRTSAYNRAVKGLIGPAGGRFPFYDYQVRTVERVMPLLEQHGAPEEVAAARLLLERLHAAEAAGMFLG